MKIRIVFIASLAILAVLIIMAIVRPAVAGNSYSELSREHLIQTGDVRVIQFDITNHEGQDMQYTIKVAFGDYRYSQVVDIRDGKVFTYSHTLNQEQPKQGDISFDIYKAGEASPFEKATYHLN